MPAELLFSISQMPVQSQQPFIVSTSNETGAIEFFSKNEHAYLFQICLTN